MYLDEENFRIARKEYKDFVNTYHENVSFDYFVDCIYTPTEEIQHRKEMRSCKKDTNTNNDNYSYRGFFDSVCIVDDCDNVRLLENVKHNIMS